MNSYQKFQTLCLKRHVTEYRVSKDTGISSSTFTNWGQGKWNPKREKLQTLADYFGVNVNYFYDEVPTDPEKDILYSAYKKASPDMKKAVLKLLDCDYIYTTEDGQVFTIEVKNVKK